jgi:putrescine aminotransferase
MPALCEFAGRYPSILQSVTGKGLLIGLHFLDAALGYQVAAGLFKRGVLVAGTLTNANTIRIEPPLVITYQQLDAVVDRLGDTLAEVARTNHLVAQESQVASTGHD